MTKDYSSENHLSKDELLQILNEIDAEQQQETKPLRDHASDITSHPGHPEPGNPFF